MKLFEPITIKNMTLPNRIVYPAIQLNLGMSNRRARAYFSERARGGAGLILTGDTSIDNFACEDLWGGTRGFHDFVKRVKVFTDGIHAAGSKVSIQLWQNNRYPQGKGTQVSSKEVYPEAGDRVAPSAREDMRALTLVEIDSIIYRFAKSAYFAREAGFDSIEIHGAHTYLLAQFANPDLNQRTDQFGVDLNGRMKFGLDIVKATRSFVGPDYPIMFRLGVMEIDGQVHPDSITYARELEKAGVDLLDISTSGWCPIPIAPPKKYPMGTFVYLAEPVKKAVNIPVIAVGRINTAAVAESILTGGKADLVAIGRQLITDPYWPQKVKDGRIQDIVACDSCNINCYAPAFERNLPADAPLCRNNSRAGNEWALKEPNTAA